MSIKQNGEEIQLVDSAGERADTAVESWEVEGGTGGRLILRDKSQTLPAGIFALSVLGDYVVVERAATTVVSGERVTVTAWTELGRFAATGLSVLGGSVVNGTQLGALGSLTAAQLTSLVHSPGSVALNILRVASAVEDGETVDIGADKYEFFTETVEALDNAGAIGVDVSGGSTIKSQGTLTVDTLPTAADTMTVGVGGGQKVYTFVASGDFDADGEIPIAAADLAATKLSIVAAINGTDGVNTAHTQVTAAAFVGDDTVITAIKGGTFGDTIDTTETFTAGTNVFDAATLGTTTAGVDPTAGEASDALIAAINASGTENVLAVDISANEVLVLSADAPGGTAAVGAIALACAETMGGTNNAWAAAAMFGGAAPATLQLVTVERVPTAVEVALTQMHFEFDFAPTVVSVLARVTSTSALRAIDPDILVSGNRVTLNQDGGTDFAATDTIVLTVVG